jgi:hypothetical protein
MLEDSARRTVYEELAASGALGVTYAELHARHPWLTRSTYAQTMLALRYDYGIELEHRSMWRLRHTSSRAP